MTTEFKWWHSQDQESWHGPFATKEEATGEGRKHYENESFYICEARLEDYHQLTIDPNEVLEQVGDRYIEFGGSDEPLFNDVEPAKTNLLGIMLTNTFHEWIKNHNIKTGIYAFAESRNEEVVEPEVK